MDKYYTIMVIPSKNRGAKSFKIPRLFFHTTFLLIGALIVLVSILGYDYWKILKQVYQNKHLSVENRQLKEQIQLFQMKLNSLTDDIERIRIFEKKLRVITGLDPNGEKHLSKKTDKNIETPEAKSYNLTPNSLDRSSNIQINTDEYKKLRKLYEQKIATTFGLQAAYSFTKEWSDLTKKSFALADDYASFDSSYNSLKNKVANLEVQVHELDQYLLDQDSFLKSLPTLIPSNGWITSYFGPRKSPYSGRLKMHEGLDIGAPKGTPIYAPADAIVTFSGAKPGFGNVLQLTHGYGIETIYAHNQKLTVKKGQVVKRGALVATVGNTGYSTGPHLHYEIKVNGIPVDPLYYILD